MSKIAIIFRVSRIFLCIFDSFKTQIEVKKTPDNSVNLYYPLPESSGDFIIYLYSD